MRILHTSDWHLGARTGPASRADDHDAFFDRLVAVVEERAIDALAIAGDIFDHAQPSADAQRQYFRLLVRLAATGLRDVVVVGGNHDAPSRLDAPAEVLAALSVHVVGGLPDDRARCLIPLRRRGREEPAAVCLAVPYVHEHWLGVRSADADRATLAARFREAFTALYADLVDHAEAAFPGLPVIATGHLTLGADATRDDYPQEIHQVGYVDALPASVLDPRLRYVALGHIHRSYPVAPNAWYSGSPIPLSLPEASRPRRVLAVDLDPLVVTPVDLPVHRDLRLLTGTPAEVASALRALTSDRALPPLVHARVTLEAPDPTLARQLQEAIDHSPARPVLVDLQTVLANTSPDDADAALPDLASLTPSDVLRRMARDRADAEALVAALHTLAAFDDESFAAHLTNLGAA